MGAHAANFKDLTGEKFGKRTVLNWHSSPIYRGKKGSSLWRVLCECGKESLVSTSTLKKTSHCGCDLSYTKISGVKRRSSVPVTIRTSRAHRRLFFRMSPEHFEQMLRLQDNRCACCEVEFVETPHVDHDHACCAGAKTCGKCIRGLLCRRCNCGLGSFRDNPDLLGKALAYLTVRRASLRKVS